MLRPLHLSLVVSVAALASGEAHGEVRLRLEKIDFVPPVSLIDADTYHVIVENDVAPYAAASLSLPGQYVNTADRAFHDTVDYPVIFGITAFDTYIVLPPGTRGTELSVDVVDSETLLQASYSLPGTTPVVGLGESVLAVLSVPLGYDLEARTPEWSVTLAVPLIPEPSSAALVAFGLAAVVRRRARGA